MGSLDKIAKAGLLVFLGMGFERFFGYFFRVLVARAGVEVYGLYSLGLSVVLTLVSLSMLGLTDGLVRFVSFHAGRKDKEGVNRIVSSTLKVVLPLSVFFMLVVFSFSNNLSSFFNEPRLSLVLKFFSFLIPVMVLINVYSDVNAAYKRMEYVVFSKNIFAGVLRIILLLFFLYLGFSLTGVLIAHLTAFILALICLAYFTRRLITFTLVKGFDKELLSYSWPLMFTAVTLSLTERVDTLMIAYFRDTVDVALYNTAYPTAALLFIASTAILSIFLPTITGKYAKKQSIRGDYKTVTRWIFTINLPIAAIMIFYSRELLTFLFTREYVAASYALSLLGFVFFTESFFRPSIGVLKMLKRTKFILYVVILRFLVNIVLNILLIPAYGITGAAVATGLGRLTILVIMLYYVHHLTKIKAFDPALLKPVLAAAASLILIYVINASIQVHLTLLLALFLLSYTLFLFATDSVTSEDKKIMKNMINKITTYP